MEDSDKGREYDTLYNVMAEIVDRTETKVADIDRIVIEHATDDEWPCRVYLKDGSDYEGIYINMSR